MSMAARAEGYRSRVRGCLAGGAIGDALGAPVEFMALDAIRAQRRWPGRGPSSSRTRWPWRSPIPGTATRPVPSAATSSARGTARLPCRHGWHSRSRDAARRGLRVGVHRSRRAARRLRPEHALDNAVLSPRFSPIARPGIPAEGAKYVSAGFPVLCRADNRTWPKCCCTLRQQRFAGRRAGPGRRRAHGGGTGGWRGAGAFTWPASTEAVLAHMTFYLPG
jgi:hypothetical protein